MSRVRVLQGALNNLTPGQFDELGQSPKQAGINHCVGHACFALKSSNTDRRNTAMAEKAPETKPGFSPQVFAQEAKAELSKVTWPSRQQLISESVAVMLMVTLSAFLVYGIDQLFKTIQAVVFK
jgi:preprotein translocase subunit SecE